MKKIILGLCLLLCFSCSEDESSNSEPQNSGEVEIKENVFVLDGSSQLLSTNDQLLNGLYIFELTDENQDLIVGDVFVGQEGEGFLRKVEEVLIVDDKIILSTTQATLEDVFENAEFSLGGDSAAGRTQNTTITFVGQGIEVSEDGYLLNFSDCTLFENENYSLVITGGSLEYNPNFVMDFDFNSGTLEYFQYGTDDTSLKMNGNLFFGAEQSESLVNQEATILEYEKKYISFVGYVPVVVIVETDLVAKVTADISAQVGLNLDMTMNNVLDMGVSYNSGAWSGTFDNDYSFEGGIENVSQITVGQNVTITPKVDIKLYGVVGPYCKSDLKEDFNLEFASENLNWDASIDTSIGILAGADVTVLGETLLGYETELWSYNQNIWAAPNSIEFLTEEQEVLTGEPGEPLQDPIKVKVLDTFGEPVGNVRVHFSPTEGGGTLDSEVSLTNSSGIATVNWTLGEEENQSLTAKIKGFDDSVIGELTFNAIASELILEGDLDFGDVVINTSETKVLTIQNPSEFNSVTVSSIDLPDGFTIDWTGGIISPQSQQNVNITFEPLEVQSYEGEVVVINGNNNTPYSHGISGYGIEEETCGSTFTDSRDGQEYQIVEIGGQCWFAENLNYETSNSSCYDNDDTNCETYGELYNFSSVSSACPPGSHLPSSAEWQSLIDALGGIEVAGGKMKSLDLWTTPNVGATNESGFAGLPGGNWTTYPPPSGSFGNMGSIGYYWASDGSTVVLNSSSENVGFGNPNLEFEFSCRCVLD